MCLVTPYSWGKCVVTKKPKTVYKILKVFENGEIRAGLAGYSFTYQLGKLYETRIFPAFQTNYLDEEDSRAGAAYMKEFNNPKMMHYGAGFHSASTKKRLAYWINQMSFVDHYLCTYQLFECTLPIGTEYYKGFTSLLVSNQIIINRQIS